MSNCAMKLLLKMLTLIIIGHTLRDCAGHWVKTRPKKQHQHPGKLEEILDLRGNDYLFIKNELVLVDSGT